MLPTLWIRNSNLSVSVCDALCRFLPPLPVPHTDGCSPDLTVELKFNLDQYVNKRYPGLVKIVRNSKREGLIRARIHGWQAATAPVVGFFDAHVEFNTGW